MNSGLSYSDLPPDVRASEVDRALDQMRKILALYRITSFHKSLPTAAVSVTPSAEAAVVGAFHLENIV